MWRVFIFSICLIITSSACTPSSHQSKKTSPKKTKSGYLTNEKSMVTIEAYDHYNRLLRKGFGFYISKDLIVSDFSFVKGAYKLKVCALGSSDGKTVNRYVAYDVNKNLVVLKASVNVSHYLNAKHEPMVTDSVYQLYRKQLKLFVNHGLLENYQVKDSLSYWSVSNEFKAGKPVFSKKHEFIGVATSIHDSMVVLPNKWIRDLFESRLEQPKSIYELRIKSNKVYPSYKGIKGFRILTNYGNIEIKLFNETPDYRDNFIKLVCDEVYDSLLFHRVINNFLIQTGALDSKLAKKDDVVGWQGPGYTLPTKIVPGLFHQRGMIAASKLPSDHNKRNRSDGSQFYIVSGRKYSSEELDDMEEKSGKKFSELQRQVYSTIGGAPHLDGDYTVFGQVTKGMDVVDKVAALETYAVDRPVQEVRIKTIEIIKQ